MRIDHSVKRSGRIKDSHESFLLSLLRFDGSAEALSVQGALDPDRMFDLVIRPCRGDANREKTGDPLYTKAWKLAEHGRDRTERLFTRVYRQTDCQLRRACE